MGVSLGAVRCSVQHRGGERERNEPGPSGAPFLAQHRTQQQSPAQGKNCQVPLCPLHHTVWPAGVIQHSFVPSVGAQKEEQIEGGEGEGELNTYFI